MAILGDRVVREGKPVRRVTMYPVRMRLGLAVLGSGLFIAAGVYLVIDGDRSAVGIMGIVFFGAGAVLGLGKMFSRRPVLVVDERGISNATSLFGTKFLPWADIARVYEHRRSGPGQSWIGVDLRKGAPSELRIGAHTRLTRALFGGSMHIMTLMLPLPIEDVLGEIGTVAPEDVDVMGRSRRDWDWWYR